VAVEPELGYEALDGSRRVGGPRALVGLGGLEAARGERIDRLGAGSLHPLA